MDQFSGHSPRGGSVQAQPLPPAMRARLARLFRADLRGVRVAFSALPEQIGALAFAHGETVLLSPAVLALRPAMYRAVLGHEIAHVLQQRGGATRGRPAEAPVLEGEAARAGRRIAAGRAPSLGARTRRRRAASVQRIKLALKGTKDGDLDAATLLNLMDSALATKLVGAAACARVTDTYTITQGGHWLSLLGYLAMGTAIVPFNQRRASVLPCSVKIGNAGSVMPVYEYGGTTERIDFPVAAVRWARGDDVARTRDTDLKRDLNYIQIADGFRKLNNSGHTDAEVAADMLRKMQNKPMAKDYGAQGNAFIEAVVALMFGIEASRFPSSFVCSLLLLDLVRTEKTYGRAGAKRFKLTSAFNSAKSFDFDCLYGGKFPCAVHEPGKGNAANRRMLGELGGKANADDTVARGHFNRGEGVNMMLDLNHRFIVPRREVTLMVHWLEARFGGAFLPMIRRQDVQKAIEGRIAAATDGGDTLPGLMFSPRRDSGMHSSDVPGQRTAVGIGTTVYYQTYDQPQKRVTDRRTGTVTFVDQPAKIGSYYHTLDDCKLFGGRTPTDRGTLLSSYRVQDRGSAPLPSNVNTYVVQADGLATVRRYLCPHCAC